MLLPVVSGNTVKSGNAEDTSDSDSSAMDIQSMDEDMQPGPSTASQDTPSQILTHAPSPPTSQEPQFTGSLPPQTLPL
ncbi:hypothetical protein GG344DRAFT_76137 [Lentinula edodes]|nr:hypothetical protein GG344DRAFT_76137 [Lentinula edodes]